ncbi:dihydropteroate synthase [Aestuariivirga litoralis]|uniref:dihydropteroate synthase n=1 Tax=Aestuariivirga litoralis TaxID=2650924 RepID=UPI001FEDD787|nr:dihydropteroate synthase [Aestuariivirga litoralis]MBG1230852.1 dihydropteroate synthase [Aestuariivirga litoralis]
MKTYLRPLGLAHGPDAAKLVNSGGAFPLAGRADIAFTQAELITRHADGKIERRITNDTSEIRNHPSFTAITSPRPNFGALELNRVHVMGIVNVTPDSFSDGGVHFEAATAIAEARKMAEDGAAILDVGGESTRPGSDTVSVEQERARIMPVIEALAKDHFVSVDTRKAPLMQEALSKGAAIINDVAALQFDPDAPSVVAKAGAPVILMHAQGEPRTMQLAPKYDDVALDVYDQLAALIAKAEAAGIARSHIMVDPGIGFGKTFKQNLELLQQLTLLHGLGVGLLVGLSRKGMIGALTGEKTAGKRLAGSLGGALHAALLGAQVLRVHDVKETLSALAVFTAALDPDSADI